MRIQKTSKSRKGFTLIELLSALSIIAVLIGLLLPALQPVREETNRSRTVAALKSLCERSLSLKYELKDVLVSSYSNGYSIRVDTANMTLVGEPVHPGRTGSVTVTMQYKSGCLYTESATAKSNTERQKMYAELLTGAAQIVGLVVNGQSGNDQLALHNSLTGSYTYTVGPNLRDSSGNTVSFQSILNPNAVSMGNDIWLMAMEMVKSTMRLGAAGENYLTLPSIAVPAAPAGVTLFSHNGMVSLVNAVTDGTSNTIMLAQLSALRQNPTQQARDAFAATVNSAAKSGAVTTQEADALIDMMGIVY